LCIPFAFSATSEGLIGALPFLLTFVKILPLRAKRAAESQDSYDARISSIVAFVNVVIARDIFMNGQVVQTTWHQNVRLF
jgi:hypothetical protein